MRAAKGPPPRGTTGLHARWRLVPPRLEARLACTAAGSHLSESLSRAVLPKQRGRSCTTPGQSMFTLEGPAAEEGLWDAHTSLVSSEAGRLRLVYRTAAQAKARACRGRAGECCARLPNSDLFWAAGSPVAGSTSWP